MTHDEARRVVEDAIAACTLPSWMVAPPGPGQREARFASTFAALGFDSLAYMEFCISIHTATGVEVGIAEVESLATPGAVASRLVESA